MLALLGLCTLVAPDLFRRRRLLLGLVLGSRRERGAVERGHDDGVRDAHGGHAVAGGEGDHVREAPGGHEHHTLGEHLLFGPAWAAQGCEILNFQGSYLGQFRLVSAHFWTGDHLSSGSRKVDAFSDTIDRQKSS